VVVTNDVMDRRFGWSERDQDNAVPDYCGILSAQLLQVPRVMSTHSVATKCLVPFDDITVWDTSSSFPFRSVYFLFYLQILPHISIRGLFKKYPD
jgi:hypothetical protein